MKTAVINDTLNIVFPPDFPENNKNNNRSDECYKHGGYFPLADELVSWRILLTEGELLSSRRLEDKAEAGGRRLRRWWDVILRAAARASHGSRSPRARLRAAGKT